MLFQHYRNYWVLLLLNTFVSPSKKNAQRIFIWKTFTTYCVNCVGNLFETPWKRLMTYVSRSPEKESRDWRKARYYRLKVWSEGLWAVRYTKQSALGEAKHLAAGKVTGCLTRRGRERWCVPSVPLAYLPPSHSFFETMIKPQGFPLCSPTFLWPS